MMNSLFKPLEKLSPRTRKLFGMGFYFMGFLFACLVTVLMSGGYFAAVSPILTLLFVPLGILSFVFSLLCFFYHQNGQQNIHPPFLAVLLQMLVMWTFAVIVSETEPPALLFGVLQFLIMPVFGYLIYIGIKNRKSGKKSHKSRKGVSMPDTPTARTRPSGIPKGRSVDIYPVYQKSLDQLARHMKDLNQRERSVATFLDSFFEDSTISKSRYLSVIKNAKVVLENNYESALRAAGMFGAGEPTREREEIMQRYVSDSADVMNKIDRVIDQLIVTQQSNQLSDGNTLDALLDDLAETTTYYQRTNIYN